MEVEESDIVVREPSSKRCRIEGDPVLGKSPHCGVHKRAQACIRHLAEKASVIDAVNTNKWLSKSENHER